MNEHMDNRRVEIKSSLGKRSLHLHDHEGDYFSVTIDGDGPRATKRIWGFTDCEFLSQLFDSLAEDWRGWQGERAWKSIESDLEITARSRSTGQITISISLRNQDGSDDWKLSAPIFTEAGQLENIARQVRAFFK